jgi:hypothetical protein
VLAVPCYLERVRGLCGPTMDLDAVIVPALWDATMAGVCVMDFRAARGGEERFSIEEEIGLPRKLLPSARARVLADGLDPHKRFVGQLRFRVRELVRFMILVPCT